MIQASRNPLIIRWFRQYTRRYLQRSFHAIHLLGTPPVVSENDSLPLLVCVNHSSWWDMLLGFHVGTELIGWEGYTVMDERQLRRYRFFTQLGVMGVDRTGLTGAKEFLDYSTQLLKGQRRALYLTPQGAFTSNAVRPIRFQPGLAHLAERLGTFYFTTLVFHYEFWNERLPEAFVSFSPVEKINLNAAPYQRRAFLATQERRLEEQLDALLLCVQRRDPTLFHSTLTGHIGVSPTYDLFRALSARLRHETFSPEHGAVLTPAFHEVEPPPSKLPADSS